MFCACKGLIKYTFFWIHQGGQLSYDDYGNYGVDCIFTNIIHCGSSPNHCEQAAILVLLAAHLMIGHLSDLEMNKQKDLEAAGQSQCGQVMPGL